MVCIVTMTYLIALIAMPLFVLSVGSARNAKAEESPPPQARGSHVIESGIGAGGAQDLLGETHNLIDPTVRENGGVRVFVNCTNDLGKVLSKDDPGYERCLRKKASVSKTPVAPSK